MRSIIRALPAVLGAGALAVTAGLSAPQQTGAPALADGPAVPINRATPTKIMPLGDSNTAGADAAAASYRADLYQLLRADGRPVDFVGSGNSGPASLADTNHEGHGGWTIGQIQAGVVGWLNTYRPDVVTLQIGTNDMYDDAAAGAAPGRLSTLLDTISATLPQTRVFVTSLPQLNHADHHKRVAAFNYTIPGMVAAKVAAGKKVTFVDANSGLFHPFDFIDMWHPNYGAASKAAIRWYSALTDVPLTRLEAEESANATLNHVTIGKAMTHASGGGNVRYIDFADSSITFTFQVGAAGNYRIRARGGNGMGTPCSHQVAANGGAQATMVYPSYGWQLPGTSAVDVALTAGTNTVKFTKGDCYTELDAIDISPVPTA